MSIDHLWEQGAGEWLSGAGPQSDIVMSTRIRLARNLSTYPFPTRLMGPKRQELSNLLRQRIADSRLGSQSRYFDLSETSSTQRMGLVERHLISKEHASSGEARGVVVGHDEMLSIMINEEDHLRIQVLRSGLQVQEAWRQARSVDDELDQYLDFAFSSRFGYLTSCPTNIGTGLRISVMLHLPALVISKSIQKVFDALSKLQLAVRGFYGENTSALGNFFQISNQVTLGKSEEELNRIVAEAIPEIIRHERNKREQLQQQNPSNFEDRVWRAFGILERTRIISSEETMNFLSEVRMGINAGVIDIVSIKTINELFIRTQPAHLQLTHGKSLTPNERDELRATVIRETLTNAQK